MANPPRSREFVEVFRYIIQSMDSDDPNMDFIVSLWSFVLANGTLTIAQADKVRPYCIKYLQKNGIDYKELPEVKNGQN